MGRARRQLLGLLGLAAAVLLGGGAYVVWRGGEIVSDYTAKILCSCVFVAGRDPASCLAEDLGAYAGLFEARIDPAARAAYSTGLFVRHARATHRDGLGCTLE